MGKGRNGVRLVAAVMIVALCGALPALTAWFGDRAGEDQLHYEAMEPVALQFREENREEAELGDLGLAFLLSSGNMSVEVIPAEISDRELMPGETNPAWLFDGPTLEREVQRYIDAGLLPQVMLEDRVEQTAHARIYMTEHYSHVFWILSLAVDRYFLELFVEPESSRIFALEFYQVLEPGERYWQTQQTNEELVAAIREVYLADKDMDLSQGLVSPPEVIWDAASQRDPQGIQYSFGDQEFGEVALVFCVSDVGFRVAVHP